MAVPSPLGDVKIVFFSESPYCQGVHYSGVSARRDRKNVNTPKFQFLASKFDIKQHSDDT